MVYATHEVSMRVLLLFALSACAKPAPTPVPVPPAQPDPPTPPEATGGPWTHTVYADHPLVGRIWSTRAGGWVDESAMLADLAWASF